MPLANLISSGLGLAFEANEARKAHKTDKAARSRGNDPQSGSSHPEAQVTEIPGHRIRHRIETGEDDRVESKSQTLMDEQYDDPPPAYAEAERMDEADWQLDEAVPDAARSPSLSVEDDTVFEQVPSGEEARKHYVDKIVKNFINRHPPPPNTQATGNLPCPVIIPQRRPHNKRRGFVQAYAPVLKDCGIDQDSFLQFHKAMYKASQASPVFEVINFAAAIAGFVPSIAAMITSAVVQAATKVAIEVQSRQRTNSFLDQMNDNYFRPRGLFCMVMKYDPNEKASHERVDISSTVVKTLSSSDSRTRSQMKNFKAASGKTYGEIEMAEAAPLIFPNLDRVDDVDENGKSKSGFKKTGEFLANYYDKRAQVKYTAEHQGSTLAGALPQERKFASRFGDPNHPVNNGSLISLVTGGCIDPKGNGSGRQGALRGGLGGGREGLLGRGCEGFGFGGIISGPRGGPPGSYYNNASTNDLSTGRRRERHRSRDHRRGDRQDHGQDGLLPIKHVKRMLQPNMLYLMVVNMPTAEEMDEARAILAASQR